MDNRFAPASPAQLAFLQAWSENLMAAVAGTDVSEAVMVRVIELVARFDADLRS